MPQKVYVMPETYEEGVKRKQEVLEKINSYNEAIFSGGELPFTDEEINELMEEYEILNDRLKLTKEEKLKKLDEKDLVVLEDGTVEKRLSALDKVHWSFFIYPFVLLFFASGILSSQLAQDWMFNFVTRMHAKAYLHGIAYNSFTDSEYMFSAFGFYARLIFFSFIIPIATSLVAFIIYILFKIFKPENAKLAFIVFIVILVVSMVSALIFFFVKILPNYGIYYTEADSGYYAYCYQKYLEQQYGA